MAKKGPSTPESTQNKASTLRGRARTSPVDPEDLITPLDALTLSPSLTAAAAAAATPDSGSQDGKKSRLSMRRLSRSQIKLSGDLIMPPILPPSERLHRAIHANNLASSQAIVNEYPLDLNAEPYLKEAFDGGSLEIFSYLLQKGAKLSNISSEQLFSSARNISFLEQVKLHLKFTFDATVKRLHGSAEKIRAVLQEKKLHLSTQSAITLSPTLENESGPLIKMLVKLCTPLPTQNDEISDIIGLAEAISLQNLMAALCQLLNSPHFQFQALRVLTLFIEHDRFHQSYKDPQLIDSILRSFPRNFEEHKPLFVELFATKQENLVLIQLQTNIGSLLAQRTLPSFEQLFPQKLKNRHLDDIAKKIAHELRALTLQFYQQLNPAEFREQAWKKPETKELTSPNILNQLTLFNRISAYFTHRILTATDESQRILTLKLILKILRALTGELIDLNSAMAVCSALDHNAISRLDLFSHPKISQKYRDRKADIEKLLDTRQNYSAQRQVLASSNSTCFPFLGIILRDLTFAGDGNGELLERCKINGKIYRDLFSRLDNLRRIDLPSQFALLPTLQTAPDLDRDEDMLTGLSYIIKPRTPPGSHPGFAVSAPTLTPAYDTSLAATAAAAANPVSPPAPQENRKSTRQSNGFRH
jgi:hypothetical protein